MSEHEGQLATPVRCTGCGIELQSESPDHPGYVPESAMSREAPVCRRCFRIRHYGEFSRIVVPHEVYEREVSTIASHPGLVFYVVDVFDLPGSVIPGLANLIGQSRVVAVVNKVDLLPKEVHVEALERWIRKELEASGVKLSDVLFVSGRSGRGIDDVLAVMQRHHTDAVYVVGMANVGKSTMLNRLVDLLERHQPFTASRVPGTTIGMVSTRVTLPNGNKTVLVDTPGLMHGDRVIDKLCGTCLKMATPQQPIRPKIYQLDAGQSVWMGGFARFDFVSGPHQAVVFYVSNDLVLHRTKLEKAAAFGEQHADDILKAPCPECRQSLGSLCPISIRSSRLKAVSGEAARVLEVPIHGCDIVLSGLGWLVLQGQNIRGTMWVPEDVRVTTRPRLVGHLSRGARI
jgi:30S ribosome assembly GTPase